MNENSLNSIILHKAKEKLSKACTLEGMSLSVLSQKLILDEIVLFDALETHGFSYLNLLDQERKRRCYTLILNYFLSCKNTACELGYRCPAQLYADFHRWSHFSFAEEKASVLRRYKEALPRSKIQP